MPRRRWHSIVSGLLRVISPAPWIEPRVLHRIKSRPQATRLRCRTNCCPLVLTGPSRDFNFCREKFKPVNESTRFARPIAFRVKCYCPRKPPCPPSFQQKCFEDDKTAWAESRRGLAARCQPVGSAVMSSRTAGFGLGLDGIVSPGVSMRWM